MPCNPLFTRARMAASLLTTAILTIALMGLAPAAPARAQQGPVIERISGDDGITIAASVSQRFTVDTATVVLARADSYADALAGAPLARLRGAPILLLPRSAPLPAVVFNELDRLDPQQVVVLGGDAAIDGSVVQAVQDMGIAVERIGGATRFETAALIAGVVAGASGETHAYVVRGGDPSPSRGWPDAVAVSALAAAQGRPILLSDAQQLSAPTRAVLDTAGIRSVDVVGGTAVLDDAVVRELADAGRDVERIAGATRFETSAAIARAGLEDGVGFDDVFLVTGGNYADALATSVPAAATAGTMLMVDGRNWAGSTARQMIADRFGDIDTVTVVGSGNDVPVRIDHELVDRVTGRATVDTSGAVRIGVGEDIQGVIDRHPPGTHFAIGSGVHRGQTITPRDGDRITGEPGAILNGGVPLDPGATGQGVGGIWVLPAPPVEPGTIDASVEMVPGSERQAYPHELWAGHVRLRHVNTIAELDRPGTWYHSYETDEAFTYDDPRSLPQPLEMSVTPEAIHTPSGGEVTGVTIRNLTVMHYANRPSRGVLDLGDGHAWDVGGVTVIDNHGVGVRTGPGLHLHDSRIVRNGQMGIGGTDTDFQGTTAPLRIERNEVSFNGELGFEWAWEGGSIKFGDADGTQLVGNWVHNHPGPGPWMDEFGTNTTFAQNLVEHNGINGLMHEISTGGTIIDNTVRYNGVLAFGDLGSGVWVSNSPDVEIGWNVIEGNRLPINAQTSRPQEGRPAMPITDLDVHDNDIRIDHLLPGMRVTSDDTFVYREGNNRFVDNRYRTRLDSATHFFWGDVFDIPGWQQELGFDQQGRFDAIALPAGDMAGRPRFGLTPFGAS